MAESYCYKEVLPFTAMIAIECTSVGVNILYKAATEKGLSYYAFIAYSFAVSTLFLLLPLPFVFRWCCTVLHIHHYLLQFKSIILYKSILQFFYVTCAFYEGQEGFLRSTCLSSSEFSSLELVAQLCGYKGLKYTSPTLFSALSNLLPAFTFILAIIFRMEKIDLRRSSTQAKILGSLVCISGALIVVLYKGPTILSTSYPQPSPIVDSLMGSTSQTNWVIGGSLLAIEFFLVPIWYIVQTKIMKEYPAEFIVVFLYNLSGTLISAPVCLLLETNLSGWKINRDITLIAIIYSGFFCTGLGSLVHTWGLHLKGPVYVSIFKPLSVFVAAALSVTFLGDSLYIGTVVGAVVLSLGFYGVIWGKAKEELSEDFDIRPPSSSKTPLLRSYKVKDNEDITFSDS
ncbi:WAT1-related protein, partial [Mucuna pruriens]